MRILLLILSSLLLATPDNSLLADDSYQLYFFRHAEKRIETKVDPGLTALGKARAAALARHFNDIDITRLYSTNYKRTLHTAAPLAASRTMDIKLYDPKQLSQFAELLKTNKVSSLVIGHSNTTPELVKLLGGEPLYLSDDDYGDLTILTMSGTQVKTRHIKINP